jgi:hypothetical protein
MVWGQCPIGEAPLYSGAFSFLPGFRSPLIFSLFLKKRGFFISQLILIAKNTTFVTL